MLLQDFDFVQVCVGDLLRREAAGEAPIGKTIAEIMQKGEIVPGEVTMTLLNDELAKFGGSCDCVLIDGFPRAMDQAHAFEELVATCEFVLYFNCDESVMIRRLSKRAETSGRADDNEEVVKRRLQTFTKTTMPVIDYYRRRGLLREVDSAIGTPDEVYEYTKDLFRTMHSPS